MNMKKDWMEFQGKMESKLGELGFLQKGRNWTRPIGKGLEIRVDQYGTPGTHTVGYDMWLFVKGREKPLKLRLSLHIEDLNCTIMQFLLGGSHDD